jgi:hypothetical protein
MKLDKPYYVTSYVKQFAIDESGTKHIDKSVYDEVQAAIESVLSRGFEIKNGRAVLKSREISSDAVSEPEREETETGDMEQLSGIPRSGVFGSGNIPAVLIRIADGTVLTTNSNMDVTVIDIDRIGRMVGNMAYDPKIKKVVESLRKIGNRVKGFDCKAFADYIEQTHEERR